MGASGWAYTVDYDQDIDAALERLREQVFREGDYYPRAVNPAYVQAVGMQPMTENRASIEEPLACRPRREPTASWTSSTGCLTRRAISPSLR